LKRVKQREYELLEWKTQRLECQEMTKKIAKRTAKANCKMSDYNKWQEEQ